MYRPIIKAHGGKPFHFPPASLAVPLTQSRNISNAASSSDDLRIRNLPDDLEIHRLSIKTITAAKFKWRSA
jgi:hypothetical protein